MYRIDFDNVSKPLQFVSNLLVSKRLCIKTTVNRLGSCSTAYQPNFRAVISVVSPTWLSTGSFTLALSAWRAFVVGLGYAPVPSKMASKITIAVFIEQAELWAENLRVQETEPHMCLGGKLVVAPARKCVSCRDHWYSDLDPGVYHPCMDRLQRPSNSLLEPRTWQVIDLANNSPTSWTCLAELWCCIQEGCCGFWLG